MGTLQWSGGGRRWRFAAVLPTASHALSTATEDGASAAKVLISFILASSDFSSLAHAPILAAVVYDPIWPCLKEEERERGKRESKGVEGGERDIRMVRERELTDGERSSSLELVAVCLN